MIDPLSRRDMIDASLNGTFSYVFLISEASHSPWSGRPSSREAGPTTTRPNPKRWMDPGLDPPAFRSLYSS